MASNSTMKFPNGFEIAWDMDDLVIIPRKAVPAAAPAPAPPVSVKAQAPKSFTDIQLAATKQKSADASTKLFSLPDELLLKIIKRLGAVDATILGITHSRLYRLVNVIHPGVPLYEISYGDRWGRNAGFLWEKLDDWMGLRVFSLYADGGAKFVTRARAEMLEERHKSPWKFGAFGRVTWRG